MPTLSMIDTTAKGYEAIAPTKPVAPQRETFDKLLNDKQPPRAEPAKASKQADQAEPVEPVERPGTMPAADPDKPGAEPQAGSTQTAARQQHADQPADPELTQPPLAQQLIALLQTIAAGESPAASDQFGSSESQLSQLVEQLEGTELQGEQVLAGIDLSALVEQLQEISASPDGKAQLAQLVTELATQQNRETGLLEPVALNSDVALQENAELAAVGMIKADPQPATPALQETLAQVRRVLQKALDALSGQPSGAEQQVAETEEATLEPQPLPAQPESKIDPRFSGLLAPRPEHHHPAESLRQRGQQNSVQPVAAAQQLQTAEPPAVATELPAETVVAAREPFGAAVKPPLENLLQQLQGNAQQEQQPAPQLRSLSATTPTVQLPSGQQVAESQIFDQVVTRMSGSFNGESGKMVLRLQPAELGSLKLELVVEGDKVRASLVAQSQQVQEVLERNLPQLRSALAEQGLKIDQFRVDVDQRQQQSQFDNLAQQQQQRGRSQQHAAWQQQSPVEEQIIPLAHLLQNGGSRISLRV